MERTVITKSATFSCERIIVPISTTNPTGIMFNITWDNRHIDIADIRQVGGVVKNSTDYGNLPIKTLNMLRSRTSLNRHQILSARSALLKNKVIVGHNRMNLLVSRIIPEYEKDGILAVSQKYDFPPLSLLRCILLLKGYRAKKLRNIFVHKINAADVLSPHDMSQYVTAEANDAESLFNQQMVAEIAAANELKFVNYFRSLGISLKDENEIAEEQINEYGRAIATPDILFIDTVFVNGEKVSWLDYKDYIGTNVRFLYMSNTKQAHEYDTRWGHGAICYHHGFISEMDIPGAMLLDAASLPIKLQNRDAVIKRAHSANDANGEDGKKDAKSAKKPKNVVHSISINVIEPTHTQT